MGHGGYSLDPDALGSVASGLDTEGSTLYDAASPLDVSPDAGRSSDEVARALAGLASSVAGLAEHVGSLADGLTGTVASYRSSDDRAADRSGGPR